MTSFDASAVSQSSPQVLRLRCPTCRHQGTFESMGVNDLHLSQPAVTVGVRRCPNQQCYSLVFVAYRGDEVVDSYPPELIDFDATNVPPDVVEAFGEALQCHAVHCHTAAAIMVRKTLEELCRDQKADGANLKDRIKALGTKVVLPKELLDGLDDLRLLGNDAAHVEAKVYDEIGEEEVEVGIEFTKEVLKAVYQYGALLEKLRALKASNGSDTG